MSMNFSLKLNISLTSQQIKSRVYDNKPLINQIKRAIFQESISGGQLGDRQRETDEEEINRNRETVGAFHHQFRKSGEIENKFHRMLDKAYEGRQKADYKRFKFSKEEAEKRFNEAQTFIERIEGLLKKEGFLADFKSLS